MFNYVSTQIGDYHGWILQQYNVAPFRDCLEELLVSNFTSQTPYDVSLNSKSADREVYRLKIHTEEVYLKRYYTFTWKQKIQTLFHIHKAQKAWKIGRTLIRRGIPTPLPIVYLTRRTKTSEEIPPLRGVGGSLLGGVRGGYPLLSGGGRFAIEHILVTQGIEHGIRLSDYVHRYVRVSPECGQVGLSLTEKRGLIRSVAEFLAKLHEEGVYHGDFTARNILVEDVRCSVQGTPAYSYQGGIPTPDPSQEGIPPCPPRGGNTGQCDQFRVYLIDLDAVRSTHWISDRRRMKNLDELGRNFLDLRVFNTTDRGRFLRHYLRANPKESRTFKQLFRCVLQRTQQRLQKYGKQFSPSPNLLLRQAQDRLHQGGGTRFSPSLVGGAGREGNWNLHVLPRWKVTFPTVEAVFDILSNPVRIVQENDRGSVLLIQHNETLFVAKRSKIQEHKRWAQFTSLYRKGEGARLLRNMMRLYSLGLPVPEPVFVLEKTVYGFVVASWSLYRYFEGHPCSCAQSHLIADILKKIHQQGWVHRDPHVKNFLWDGEKICIIDCARARPWRSRYAQMYDVVLLDKCCPGSLKYYDISGSYGVYRLAKFHNTLIKSWRRIKRKIRSRTP